MFSVVLIHIWGLTMGNQESSGCPLVNCCRIIYEY